MQHLFQGKPGGKPHHQPSRRVKQPDASGRVGRCAWQRRLRDLHADTSGFGLSDPLPDAHSPSMAQCAILSPLRTQWDWTGSRSFQHQRQLLRLWPETFAGSAGSPPHCGGELPAAETRNDAKRHGARASRPDFCRRPSAGSRAIPGYWRLQDDRAVRPRRFLRPFVRKCEADLNFVTAPSSRDTINECNAITPAQGMDALMNDFALAMAVEKYFPLPLEGR